MDNCTIQKPGKPSVPVDMGLPDSEEANAKEEFWQVPWHETPVNPLPQPGSDICFPQQTSDSYVPSTIIGTVSTPRSYLINAQGKQFHRSREHIHPLQQDLFEVTNSQLQETPKPTCIPKPNLLAKYRALPYPPKQYPSKPKSSIPIPHPQEPSQPNATPSPISPAAMVDDLLHHLAFVNDPSP